MLNPKELLSSSLEEIKKTERKLPSIHITYDRVKTILSSLEPENYGSIKKMTNLLYKKGILTYSQKKVKKIKKQTVNYYLRSCIELKILTRDGNLSDFGKILVDTVNNEKEFKKLMGANIKNRKDVKAILSILNDVKIPTLDETRRHLKEILDIREKTFASLMNLLAECNLIHKNRNITYYPLTIASRIIELLQKSEKTLKFDELDQILKNQGFSGVEIQEELVNLLVDNLIDFSEKLPEKCLNLLKLTIEFDNSFSRGLTIKLTPEYHQFLTNKGINDPPNYIDNLVKEYYEFLEIAPYSASINLLSISKISSYNSNVYLK